MGDFYAFARWAEDFILIDYLGAGGRPPSGGHANPLEGFRMTRPQSPLSSHRRPATAGLG